jgi:hypothetical protein
MPSKYDALVKFLNDTRMDRVTLTFDQIDNIVDNMPLSAWNDRTWWGNSKHPSRTQAATWIAGGWIVDGKEFSSGRITFNRTSKSSYEM